MGRRFISANRAQPFLFPPCIDDWVEEDHFARFLVDCVDHFDLRGFTHAYSPEGGAPYEPKMMLTVLLYAWCQGIRSSRKIAAACRNRIDFRWLTGNLRPDHCAFARFFQRHGEEIRELFTRVLYLCGQAGAVRLGVVSLDGTKVCGSASLSANRTLSRLREEIRRMEDEMRRADAADNARFGSRGSGEELPEELRDHRQRLSRLRLAYERLELDLATERALASSPSKKASESGGQAPSSVPAQGELPFGPAQDTAVVQPSSCGGVEASGASPAASSGERGGEEPPVSSPGSAEESAAGESRCCAGERETSEQTARSEQREKTGKGRGSKKKAKKKKEARVNVTDADSRIMKGRQGFVQGYNGQAVVNEDQFVVACGVTQDENDLHQLEPMLLELERSLAAAGIEGRAKWLNADAGYWRQDVEVDKLEQASIPRPRPPSSTALSLCR